MSDNQHRLLECYERLEDLLKRRDHLGVYLLLYGGGLMLFASLPSRAWRFWGLGGFYISLALVTLMMGLIGLALLVRFVVIFKEIREAREEIDYYKYAEPETKQKRTRFIIGDDGELIPVEAEEEADYQEQENRRMYL